VGIGDDRGRFGKSAGDVGAEDRHGARHLCIAQIGCPIVDGAEEVEGASAATVGAARTGGLAPNGAWPHLRQV
jgi:hypothetical protein